MRNYLNPRQGKFETIISKPLGKNYSLVGKQIREFLIKPGRIMLGYKMAGVT
jgi:hypothetical protein